MRITPQVIVAQTIANAQAEYAQIGVLQAQVSSGNRITNVSDDPSGALRVMTADSQNASLNAYQQNISASQTTLNLSVSTLGSVGQLLSQANSLALQGANTSNDASTNSAVAQEVDSILQQMVTLANTQSGGQYLYGGTATKQAPFAVSSQNATGGILQVAYNRATQSASAPVTRGNRSTRSTRAATSSNRSTRSDGHHRGDRGHRWLGHR